MGVVCRLKRVMKDNNLDHEQVAVGFLPILFIFSPIKPMFTDFIFPFNTFLTF